MDKKKPATIDWMRVSVRYGTSLNVNVVPEVGIEPTWGCPRWILSPVRLPVSPLRQFDH